MSLIINKLKKETVIYCPLCNKEYQPDNLKLVEQAGETILAHSHCPVCAGAVLSLLYKDFLGITLLGLVTDLDYADTMRLKGGELVDEDGILALYKALIN